MSEQKKRLERELDHLTKTFKAGIMSEKEYKKGKERIERKLKDVEAKKVTKKETTKASNNEKSKKIIDEILDEKPKAKPKAASKKKKEEDDSFPTGFLVLGIILIIIAVLVYNNNNSVEPFTDTDKVVTLTIYSDVHCAQEAKLPTLLKQIKQGYGDRVEFKYVHTPLEESSVRSMLGLICAGQQGKFWKYHEQLVKSSGDLTNKDLIEIAPAAEVTDEGAFATCLEAQSTQELLTNDILNGVSIRVEKTPSFVVGNELYEGFRDYKSMKLILNKHLAAE